MPLSNTTLSTYSRPTMFQKFESSTISPLIAMLVELFKKLHGRLGKFSVKIWILIILRQLVSTKNIFSSIYSYSPLKWPLFWPEICFHTNIYLFCKVTHGLGISTREVIPSAIFVYILNKPSFLSTHILSL